MISSQPVWWLKLLAHLAVLAWLVGPIFSLVLAVVLLAHLVAGPIWWLCVVLPCGGYRPSACGIREFFPFCGQPSSGLGV